MMMNCEHATRLLSEALERPLTFTEKTELRFHTLMCSGCRQFGRQMETLRHLTRTGNQAVIHQDDRTRDDRMRDDDGKRDDEGGE